MLTHSAFDALGSPTRRAILGLLSQGPQPVGELARQLPISRPAVSQHLKVLEGASLVRHRVWGTRHLFELDRTGFEAARGWLDGFWDEALHAFRELAEEGE